MTQPGTGRYTNFLDTTGSPRCHRGAGGINKLHPPRTSKQHVSARTAWLNSCPPGNRNPMPVLHNDNGSPRPYTKNDAGVTTLGGVAPFLNAMMLSATAMPILRFDSYVAEPACGVTTTLGRS